MCLIIHRRSLYTLKPETCAEPDDLPQTPSKYRGQEEGKYFKGVDQQHAKEKSYIGRTGVDKSPFPDLVEQRRFSRHIMQGYNKPKRRPVPGYGMPKVCVLKEPIKDTSDVVDLVVRPPSSYNVMPKRQKPTKCARDAGASCEFCDVLGPLSCSECIESTNRRIANDVQTAAFPSIDCTAASLVAPTLSQIMLRSNKRSMTTGARRKQVRLNRFDSIIEPAMSATAPAFTSLPAIGAENTHRSQRTMDAKTSKQTSAVAPSKQVTSYDNKLPLIGGGGH